MLQHNASATRSGPNGAPTGAPAGAAARRAHVAHAAVVGSHVLCCGLPIALTLAAAGAGASMGVAAAAEWSLALHAFLHAHELWILAFSAALVTLGGVLELKTHRGRRISALFALSVLCFTLNAGLIWAHRGGLAAPHAAQTTAAQR